MAYTGSLSLFLNTTEMTKKRSPIGSVKVRMYLCGIDQSWMNIRS